ncbi:palmitoyltransferase ZDHHC18-A [Carcharodon carcharias]|uniref:palmitoyltransferase ZDHHC18-A n=1 Tax=Carcharodon carcharias TaxID=13397 RepID=UPI001B7F7619|nr:palmitoyltransferase ZDHHC18-A [Carcharodon carcharias]XP_041069306.1 palmitoyltransferase ZDHHC18-A [Carcharodon carcharias]XP_041069307.1 palmitoyltransferase ZDHHC18-A [Carcharodon carcharias]
MTVSDLQLVVHFALCSRILTVLFQMVFNSLIPDHRADAFQAPQLHSLSIGDALLEIVLGGFSRWDAQHFLFIAEFGYIYEHNFAFLPLFPVSLRAMAETVLRPLQWLLNLHSRLLLAAVLLNMLIFVLSAVLLYQLGVVVLQDRRLASLSSLLFCLTPANVFMSAAYSESMFVLLVFSGMLHLEKGRPLISCILFSLSTAVRSNGIVNAGFLFYSQLRHCSLYVRHKLKVTEKDSYKSWFNLVLRSVLLVATGIVMIMLPFVLFQCYGYLMFCKSTVNPALDIPQPLLQLARDKGYRVPDKDSMLPSWCHHRYPIIYTYIQDTYWNVGFLRYYQLCQLPNFLLAFPVVALGVWAVWQYVCADPWYCIQLGLGCRKLKEETEEDSKPLSSFYRHRLFVYIVHMTVLLAFGICFMHIQVVTRFLASSSPILYWFTAHLLQEVEPGHLAQDSTTSPLPYKFGIFPRNQLTALLWDWRGCSLTVRCVLGYFLLYWFLGLALHCNFLPWT